MPVDASDHPRRGLTRRGAAACLALVAPDGSTRVDSAVRLDSERRVYEFRGGPPTGRVLFLTCDPDVAPGRELSSFEDFRLIRLEGGKAPSGLAVTRSTP